MIAIEQHPQFEAICDAIDAGKSSRHIAERITPPLSHVTIARFAQRRKAAGERKEMVPATPASSKALERKPTTPTVAAEANTDPAAPLRERVGVLWAEVEAGLQESKPDWIEDPVSGAREFRPGDLRARASLINAGGRLLEVDAKLRGIVGFVPGTPQMNATSNTIVVVMPNLRDVQQRVSQAEVIDIE